VGFCTRKLPKKKAKDWGKNQHLSIIREMHSLKTRKKFTKQLEAIAKQKLYNNK